MPTRIVTGSDRAQHFALLNNWNLAVGFRTEVEPSNGGAFKRTDSRHRGSGNAFRRGKFGNRPERCVSRIENDDEGPDTVTLTEQFPTSVFLGISLARRGRLLRRSRAIRRGPGGRSLPAFFSAFVGGGMARVLAAASSAGFLSAAVVLVDRRPGPALGFPLRHAVLFIALRDVIGLSFRLVRILLSTAVRIQASGAE